MMTNKINVGVVGVGNLGKSIIKQLKNHKEFNLVSIFSRRQLDNCVDIKNILDYKNQIDLLFLCGGSFNDTENQSLSLLPHFNIIDSYDNHSKLKTHITKLNKVAKSNNKIALSSIGWDPGLFSYMRGLFHALGYQPYSFWGKGTSQGHTQAIKQINGVIDAIQFTVPNKKIIKKIKNGKTFDNTDFHFRKCYVVCNKENSQSIKSEIINMPHYFKNYKTKVKFVKPNKLIKLKSFSHKGEVLTKSNEMNFSLNLNSNPDFTASVMIAYAKSITHLKKEKKFGAFTIFDIPLSYIINIDKFQFL